MGLTHVFVFDGEVREQPVIRQGREIARVSSVCYTEERVTRNLTQSFKPNSDGVYSIAMLHANIGRQSGHAEYALAALSDLAESGFDYWALGHVHTRAILSSSPAIVALKEPESVRDELEATECESEDYFAALQQRVDLDAEIHDLEQSSGPLKKRLARYLKLREAQPHQKRRAEIEAQVGQLDPIDSFPGGGVERLNLLVHQGRELEEESERQRIEMGRIRLERHELASHYTPQELIRRSRSVDSFRNLIPRRDVAEERIADGVASRDRFQNELAQIRSRRNKTLPPSPLAIGMFMAVIAAGGVGLFVTEQGPGGGLFVVVLALVGAWYYWRGRKTAAIDREIGVSGEHLKCAEADLARLEGDLQGLILSIRELTGRSDSFYTVLEKENLKIQELTDMADRIRSIDVTLMNEERRRDRIRQRVEKNRHDIHSLLRQAESHSESEFLQRAAVFRQRRKLLDELARTPVIEPEVDTESRHIVAYEQEAYQKTFNEFEDLEQRLRQARTEAGRLEERIAALGRNEDRARARVRQESILAGIDEASEEWAVLTLCRTLLDETRRIYETQRQPEMLGHASRFFRLMSEGRWSRAVAGLEGNEIFVESNEGTRVLPANLSRGTAEQLYLAMRLALVLEYSQHVVPLPVVFDDIFVNFDPDRTRRSVEAVRELSETHQILLFTCHPHLVKLVEEIVPDAKVYPLQ